ncbi:MAG: nucleotidyltransferase domain-containing protein [Blastocatellia bacterium]
MKRLPENKTKRTSRNHVPSRRVPLKTSDLPKEVREFRKKFREWEESYRDPAARMKLIQNICQRIADAYQPEKIILFGSHAYGKPTRESDVDLLIVMKFDGSPIKQAITISNELGLVTPMDMLVRTPEQIAGRLKIEDTFMREIVERGKVMYEAKHG